MTPSESLEYRDAPNRAVAPRYGFVIAGLAIVIAAGVVAWLRFAEIPDPMPTHWSGSGSPNRYSDKSLPQYIGLFTVGPLVTWVSQIGALALIRSQSRNVVGPSQARRRRIWLMLDRTYVATGWFLLALIALISASSAVVDAQTGRGLNSLWFLAGFVVALVGYFAYLWRADVRIRATVPLEPGVDPGPRLRWGFLYFEPSDPRVIISTNKGTSSTLNLARLGAWLVLAGLMAPAVLVIVLVALTGR